MGSATSPSRRRPRRIAGLLSAFVLAALGIGPGVAGALPPGEVHYPDLRTLPPSDLSIEVAGDRHLLRLTNTIWNAGEGRLELRPDNTSGTSTTAYQRLYTHDANGTWVLASEFPVGTFVFHPAHDHWHFEGFARYEIRSVARDGSIGPKVRRTASKVSFCIVDDFVQDGTLEHFASTPAYQTCPQNGIQGLDVGWADQYPAYLEGQTIDVTGLRGRFWLVSTADPLNRLAESDDTNNAGAVRIRIRGTTVTVTG